MYNHGKLNESITVADTATILDKYYYQGFDRDTFPDYWEGHIEYLEDADILSGYGSVMSNISRIVALRTVINAIDDPDLGNNDQPYFADADDIKSSDYKYVNFGVEQEILHGYPDGTFKPNQNITRAELAKILFQVKDEYRLKEPDVKPKPAVRARLILIMCFESMELAYEGIMTMNSK